METKPLTEVSQAPPNYGSQNEGTTVPSPPIEHTNVIHAVVINRQIGPHSTRIECPGCRASIITQVQVDSNSNTHLAAAIICLLGGFCGCCCIPYCMDSCKNINHYCPNCDTFIGSYKS